MPRIGYGGYAEVHHPPRSSKLLPKKYRDNESYIQRCTKQTDQQIHFGEKARRIFDPTNSISSPILFIYPRSDIEYSEIMPYRTGNMIQFFRTRRVSPSKVLKMLIPILKGLDRLHEKKIIHHDIKAENILYDNSPKIRFFLIDWGTASRYKDVYGNKYSYWLTGDNQNHPPEYKMVAREIYDLRYDDFVKEYRKNTYYDRYLKIIQPRYDILARRADREIRQKLAENPQSMDEYIGEVDVFAMGIVFCQVVILLGKTESDIMIYLPLLQGMIHPDPRKRWTIKKCIDHLEKK